MDINPIPCSQRRFVAKLEQIYTTNRWWFVQLLTHLLPRLGKDATLALWDAAFKEYNDQHVVKVLEQGWEECEKSDHEEKCHSYLAAAMPGLNQYFTLEQAHHLIQFLRFILSLHPDPQV